MKNFNAPFNAYSNAPFNAPTYEKITEANKFHQYKDLLGELVKIGYDYVLVDLMQKLKVSKLHKSKRYKDRNKFDMFNILIEDEIVGIISLEFPDVHDTIWIGWFCVSPKLQGQGIGTAVLNKIKEQFSGFDIYVSCFNSNDAQAVYKKAGFKVVGTPQEFIEKGYSEDFLFEPSDTIMKLDN